MRNLTLSSFFRISYFCVHLWWCQLFLLIDFLPLCHSVKMKRGRFSLAGNDEDGKSCKLFNHSNSVPFIRWYFKRQNIDITQKWCIRHSWQEDALWGKRKFRWTDGEMKSTCHLIGFWSASATYLSLSLSAFSYFVHMSCTCMCTLRDQVTESECEYEKDLFHKADCRRVYSSHQLLSDRQDSTFQLVKMEGWTKRAPGYIRIHQRVLCHISAERRCLLMTKAQEVSMLTSGKSFDSYSHSYSLQHRQKACIANDVAVKLG